MADPRDDMVLRPQIRPDGTSVRERAREERIIESRARNRHGVVGRLMRIRRGISAARSFAGAVEGETAAVAEGSIARGAVVRAAASPVGILIAAAVVVAIGAVRIASGQSFENMGANINKMLLGDADDEARASMRARSQLESNELSLDIANRFGATDQLKRIYDDLEKVASVEERGKSILMEDGTFQSNDMLDMLILRIWGGLKKAWDGSGGPAAVESIQEAYMMRYLTRFK